MSPPSTTSVPAAATIAETRAAIDAALRARGGAHATYSCKSVSWDDVARGKVGTSLSCWGRNITDTYLKSKNGDSLFTLRPSNWNEKLGVVSASDVALLIGNVDNPPSTLRNITLLDFLKTPSQFAPAYKHLDSSMSLHDEQADKKVSIRFQTVFLPVESSDPSSPRQTFQFAAEAYNYNTKSDRDPRNLVLLATTQGIALQADGVGAKRLLHHAVQSDGTVMQHWLEAERSDHAVGGPQKESVQERADALQRGKAASEVIGIKAMGTRFNALMTVQIPLQQQQRSTKMFSGVFFAAGFDGSTTMSEEEDSDDFSIGAAPACATSSFGKSAPGSAWSSMKKRARGAGRRESRRASVGQSNAARVSRGDAYSKFGGLSVANPKRNAAEHVTVTVVFYNTVAGGVPSAEAAIAAVSDMEELFAACTQSGRLADAEFDFMKHDLTVDDVVKIADKVVTQPVVVSNPPEIMEKGSGGGDVKALLGTKFSEFEAQMSTAKLLELRLLVLGAMEDDQETRTVLEKKFTDLKEFVNNGQSYSAKQVLREIKLIVKLKGAVA